MPRALLPPWTRASVVDEHVVVLLADVEPESPCALCADTIGTARAAAYALADEPTRSVARGEVEFPCVWHLRCLLRQYLCELADDSPTRTVGTRIETPVYGAESALLDFVDPTTAYELIADVLETEVLAVPTAESRPLKYVNELHVLLQRVGEHATERAKAFVDALRSHAASPKYGRLAGALADIEQWEYRTFDETYFWNIARDLKNDWDFLLRHVGNRVSSPRFAHELTEMLATLSYAQPHGPVLVELLYARVLPRPPPRVDLRRLHASAVVCVAAHQPHSAENDAAVDTVMTRNPELIWGLAPLLRTLVYDRAFANTVAGNECLAIARIVRAVNEGKWPTPTHQQWRALMYAAPTSLMLYVLTQWRDAPPVCAAHLAELPPAEEEHYSTTFLTTNRRATLAAEALAAGKRLSYYTGAQARQHAHLLLKATSVALSARLAAAAARCGGTLAGVVSEQELSAYMHVYMQTARADLIERFGDTVAPALGATVAWSFLSHYLRAFKNRHTTEDEVRRMLATAPTLPACADDITPVDEPLLLLVLERGTPLPSGTFERVELYPYSSRTLRRVKAASMSAM